MKKTKRNVINLVDTYNLINYIVYAIYKLVVGCLSAIFGIIHTLSNV